MTWEQAQEALDAAAGNQFSVDMHRSWSRPAKRITSGFWWIIVAHCPDLEDGLPERTITITNNDLESAVNASLDFIATTRAAIEDEATAAIESEDPR